MSSKSTTAGESKNDSATSTDKAKKREKKQNVAKSAEYFKIGLAKSRKASNKTEFADAAESFTLAVELRPSNARYYFARGNCYRSMTEFRKAYLDYTAAVRLDETISLYFANRAMVLRRMKRPAEAYEDYTRALMLDPGNGNFSFNRAVTLYELKRYEEAVKDYTKAIKENKHVFRAYYNRGNCYRRMDRLDDSVKDLKKAVELENRNPSAHNNLGLSYFEQGIHEEAINCFTEAIGIDDTNPTFYNNRGKENMKFIFNGRFSFNDSTIQHSVHSSYCFILLLFIFLFSSFFSFPSLSLSLSLSFIHCTFLLGLALYHHNDLEQALSDMNEAVARDSSKKPDPNYYFNRGNTRLARHEPQKALHDFHEALRLNNTDPRYLHSIGLARQQIEGEEHLALASFEKALECDPNHIPSRYHCGLMLHRLGQLDEAVLVFNHVLSEVTDDRLVYESRGLVYQDQGRHQKAVNDFSKAIQLDDAIGENYYHRGESRLRLGQLEHALEEFSSARGRNYEQPCLFNARGMAKRKLNLMDDAISDLDIAISRSPNPEFYLNRSTCYLDVDDPGSAEDDMTEALGVAPGDYRLLQQRGIARYAQHNFDGAIEDLFNALENVVLEKNSISKKEMDLVVSEINRYLGYSFANSGRNDRAVSRYDIVIELGIVQEEEALRSLELDELQRNNDMENMYGSKSNKEDEDVEDDNSIIKLLANGDEVKSPESVIGQLTNDYHERAKSLQLCDGEDDRGRLQDSILDFNTVIERNHKNAHAYFRRGFCHKSAGNYDRAAEDFERARALDPNNPALAINYRNIGDVECIVLVDAGREPVF
tara:strand:+ start:240 stop:2705 length:2466 start_codon:yes stop_codon:yes gene_type:complete